MAKIAKPVFELNTALREGYYNIVLKTVGHRAGDEQPW